MTYDAYKPSGIEWIGDVPAHWEVKKLKWFAKICNGQDQKGVADELGEYPIIGTGGVFGRSNKFLHEGPSVILGRKGTIDKPQFIDYPFWSVDTAYYTAIYPSVNPRYFFYACTTIKFDLYKYGSAVPSTTQEILNQILLTSPPLAEQQAIAAYLDEKTAQLDTYVSRKQALITLLKEERAGLINQYVTRGLDPNVPTKPSGIEWLGNVPAHWEVKRAKYVSNVFIPQRNKPILNMETGLPWITMDDLKFTRINSSIYGYKVSDLDSKDSGSKSLPPQSVIASCIGNFGVTAINNVEVIINQQLQAYIPFNMNPEYLRLVVYMSKSYFEIVATATTIPFVNREKFEDLPIPYPSLTEQAEIVARIEQETGRIDEMIGRIERELALLAEYRTALISEVVTGKVRVA